MVKLTVKDKKSGIIFVLHRFDDINLIPQLESAGFNVLIVEPSDLTAKRTVQPWPYD